MARIKNKNGSHGFSLIELIAAIAVVGILASILVAMVSRMHVAGERSESISQLRQVHMLHQLWIQDKNYEVTVFRGGTGVVNAWGWQMWLGGYTSDKNIFFAPSRPGSSTGFDGWHTYGMNLSRNGPVNVSKPEGDTYEALTEDVATGLMKIRYNLIQEPTDYLLFAETSLIANPDRGFMRFENARAAWNSGGIRLDRDGRALGVYLSGNAEIIEADRLRELGFTRVLDGKNQVTNL